MRGTVSLGSAAKYLKPIHFSQGRWVGTMVPRKPSENDGGEPRIEKEKIDPIVAFSRPPPVPPVLGPLVALTLLDSWMNRDNNED